MRLSPSARTVITGAGSGFGRALALAIAARKGRLVLSDVNLAAVEETARLAIAAGADEAITVTCDVSKLEEVEALAAVAARGTDGRDAEIGLVVNNAGVSSGGNIGELPIADWRLTIDVDLWGVIYGCHVFVPILRKQRSGHILNVASAAGLISTPRMGAYNVAKAGVVALSETLAGELGGSGVGVTVLCPTFFKTNIVSSGRFADDSTRRMAERLMSRGIDAGVVVEASLEAVERGQLYCVPMADGRWFWRLKRLSPESFRWLVSKARRRIDTQAEKLGGSGGPESK